MSARRVEANDSPDSSSPPAEPRVRILTPADRTLWIELRRQLWPDHTAEDLTNDADDLLSSEKGGRFWRASMPATVLLAEKASGQVIGFAEIDLRPFADGCRTSPVGYLEGWYVLPEHRGRNVGRALAHGAEAWARDQGCREMASDTEIENAASQRAHNALGYEEVDRLVHFRRDLSKLRM